MKKTLLTAAFTILTSTLSGCSALDYTSGTHVTEQQVAQFKKGVTTQEDVVQAIGQPPQKNEVGGKEIWSYPYTKIAALPLMPNSNETTVFEWSKKGILLNAYKSGGKTSESSNPLLKATGM